MAETFTTTRIKTSTLEKVRRAAELGHRSPVEQLDLMADMFEVANIADITIASLPRPADGQHVPVIILTSAQAQ